MREPWDGDAEVGGMPHRVRPTRETRLPGLRPWCWQECGTDSTVFLHLLVLQHIDGGLGLDDSSDRASHLIGL